MIPRSRRGISELSEVGWEERTDDEGETIVKYQKEFSMLSHKI